MQRLLDLPNLQRDVPLAPLTTYRIGGPADWFVAVRTADELAQAVTVARREEIPFFLLGTGANILVGDLGFRGLVIHNRANHRAVNGTSVVAESGAVIAALIEMTADAGLSGLEHFAGIPSSVGGAVWQNLHFLAPDRLRTRFIEEVIQSAEILEEDGRRRIVDREFFQFGYDDSILHHRPIIVLSVEFQLTPGAPQAIRHQARENLAWRAARQPAVEQFPSCGSVFKKIEGVGAGRLIDQAGLKGHRIGGAQISQKHANFIINQRGATAQDVLALAGLAQSEVQRQTGYELQMEIGLVGEFVVPPQPASQLAARSE
ncbi:MAG TPA: UDP-N-acetylmuramate dehydrogenase [Thermomicrobiales bacterium]|nr:UDP-N-acetylmuramate dehydrogenase [Thermomicrobiales bacterium]